MKTLTLSLCASVLLTNGARDPLTGVVEAFASLVARENVNTEDLRRMQATGNFFQLKSVGTSEAVVLRDAFHALGVFAGESVENTATLSAKLSLEIELELARREKRVVREGRAKRRVARDPRMKVVPESVIATPRSVSALFFNSDGKSIITANNYYHNISLLNLDGSKGEELVDYPLHANSQFTFGWAPQANRLYVKGKAQGEVWVLDTRAFEWVDRGPSQDTIGNVVVTKDASTYVPPLGQVAIVRAMLAGEPPSLRADMGEALMHFTPDNVFVAWMDQTKKRLRFWAADHPAFAIDTSPYTTSPAPTEQTLAFRSGTSQVVVADPHCRRLPVFDWKSRAPVFELEIVERPGRDRTMGFQAAAYSPDGRYVAGVEYGQDPFLTIWDAESGDWMMDWSIGAPNAHLLEFSPDGLKLATASIYEESVRIWNLGSLWGDQ